MGLFKKKIGTDKEKDLPKFEGLEPIETIFNQIRGGNQFKDMINQITLRHRELVVATDNDIHRMMDRQIELDKMAADIEKEADEIEFIYHQLSFERDKLKNMIGYHEKNKLIKDKLSENIRKEIIKEESNVNPQK